jgi:small ubiquitin-related modifier
METFCQRQSMDIKTVKFMFDGNSLHPDSTPDDLSMEEYDEIDAMLQQTGGKLIEYQQRGAFHSHMHAHVS